MFVVGNIQVFHNHTGLDILKTTKKLYLQGNGGLDITTNTDKDIAPGHEKWEYTNVFPNKKGFYFPKHNPCIWNIILLKEIKQPQTW